MKKANYIAAVISTIGFSLILVAMVILDSSYNFIDDVSITDSIDSKVIAASTVVRVNNDEADNDLNSLEISSEREIAPAKMLRVEVFDGLTLEELTARLNKSLGTDLLAGKGELIASYSLSKGVDPYLVTAIMLHETGCGTRCSALARTCNNVAGQKGSPSCMGSYKGYQTIDDGIRGAIDNLYNNFYAKGLTTVETIAPRYAESSAWPIKINSYITKIKTK